MTTRLGRGGGARAGHDFLIERRSRSATSRASWEIDSQPVRLKKTTKPKTSAVVAEPRLVLDKATTEYI